MKQFVRELKTHLKNPKVVVILIFVVAGVVGLALFANRALITYNDLEEQTDATNDAATIANVSSIQVLIGVYRVNNATYPQPSGACVPYQDIIDVLQGDVVTNNRIAIYYCVNNVNNPTQYRLVTKLTTPHHQELDIDLDTNVNSKQVGVYSCKENYCVGSQE